MNRCVCWRWLLCCALGLVPWSTVRGETAAAPREDDAIQQRLADADRYLSSDALEGRGPTTHGIELAADYIAAQFAQAGLRVDACDGTPFQRFQVNTSAKLGAHNRLVLTPPGGQPERSELKLGKDYTPMTNGDAAHFDLPLVFVGYGVTDPLSKYDDYQGVDVANKAVIVLRGEPQIDGKSPRAALKSSHHFYTKHKLCNAFEHGASAVIFLTNVADLRGREDRGEGLIRFGSPSIRCSHPGLPVLHCRRRVFEPAIRAALGSSLETLEARLDEGVVQSKPLAGWRISGQTDIERVKTDVKNVVAILPGEGPARSETVIVGAHYDHFGVVQNEVNGKLQRAIYHGADDNASGVSAILEIARQLARPPRRPARTIVFVSFSAEEMGLLGSAYYVAHPVTPLSRTAAMVNLDMVGRLRDNTLYVRGSFTAAGWMDMLRDLNARHNLTLSLPPDRYGSSDQLSFYAKKVPILHFFTGRHVDYHEPTDTFDKLDLGGMRRITQYVVDVVRTLADPATRPLYVAAVPQEDATEAYFGAFGDFTRAEAGYALGPVAKGGPAERAGLRDGDLVVRFGNDRIAGADDFNEAITHYCNGDRVAVVVKRGSESKTFDVTLGMPIGSSKGKKKAAE